MRNLRAALGTLRHKEQSPAPPQRSPQVSRSGAERLPRSWGGEIGSPARARVEISRKAPRAQTCARKEGEVLGSFQSCK